MPAVLIPIITAAGVSGGISLGALGTLQYASIIAYGITIAGSLGASFLLGQQQKRGDSAQQQVTVKQSLPVRTRSYGRVMRAGALGFMETGDGGALYRLVIHDEGEWDAIEQWWLNDVNSGLSGGEVQALPWGSNITIESHLGTDDQTASPALLAAFGGLWTADHRLRGLAYSVMRCGWVQEKNFGKVYPNGVPELRVVARTSKVYDPRTGLTQFSRNPALCILDHLSHRDGLRIAPAMIDQASFAAMAYVHDQPVPLAAGGAEVRYSVDLTYSLTDSPIEVHRRLLQSCDGEIYPTAEGKIGIRGGVFEEPAVTLNEDHITGYRYVGGADKLAAFNHLKLTCTNPNADYQPAEIEPWDDLASQAVLGVLQQELSLTQVTSWTQARRLGRIAFHRGNPDHKLTLQTRAAGVVALGERCVRVTLAELALDATFLIERFELRFDGTQLVGCELVLSSLSAAAYAWSTADEGGAPVTPAPPPAGSLPPEPTGLALSIERTEVTSGVYQLRLRATVNPVSGTPWETIGRYRPVGSALWADMQDAGDWAVVSDVLQDGVEYEVEAAHAGYGGALSGMVGPWCDPQTITAIADSVVTGPPTGFVANGAPGEVALAWTAPGSANLRSVRLYRAASGAGFGAATIVTTVNLSPNQAYDMVDDGLSPGAYDYWARALNRSGLGDATSTAGPITATVT